VLVQYRRQWQKLGWSLWVLCHLWELRWCLRSLFRESKEGIIDDLKKSWFITKLTRIIINFIKNSWIIASLGSWSVSLSRLGRGKTLDARGSSTRSKTVIWSIKYYLKLYFLIFIENQYNHGIMENAIAAINQSEVHQVHKIIKKYWRTVTIYG